MKKIYLVVLIVMLCLPDNAFAMRYSLSPYAGSSLTWSSNIDGSSVGFEREDFYVSPTVGIGVTLSSKKLSFSLNFPITAQLYYKFDEENDLAVTYPGLGGNLQYDISERLQLSSYSQVIYAPNESTFTEAVFRTDETTGLPVTTLVTGEADRFEFSIYPSLNYRVSQRVTSTLRTGYRTLQYSNNVDQNLSDSNNYLVGFSVNYTFSRIFSGGVDLDFERTNFVQGGVDRENDTDIYRLTLNTTYRYSRTGTLELSGGVASTSEENQERTNDFVGSASTTNEFGSSTLFVGIDSTVTGSGASFGDAEQVESLRASYSTPFFVRGNFTLAGALTHRRGLEDVSENLVITSISANCSYPVLKQLELFIAGLSSRQQPRKGQGSEIDVDTITLGFVLRASYEPPSPQAE